MSVNSLLDSATSELILELPYYAHVLSTPKRYKVFLGGRGGGKSWAIAIFLLSEGMNRKIDVLCARELQVSISDSVHKLLSNIIAANPGMSAFYEVQNQKIIGKNGTSFSFKGLKHNSSEIKSYEGVDYALIEEAQAVSDKSCETLIPTIRKEGSEIIVSFNPKNPTDPTYIRLVLNAGDDTVVVRCNWRDNPFFPSVLDQERLKLQRIDPEAYQHIWEGEFDTRYSGAVYAKKLAALIEAGRVDDRVKPDPSYPIYTAWDLGWGDSTAIIWYQAAGDEVFIIDYYETNMEDIKHYAEVMYGREIVIEERELITGEVLKWRFGDVIEEHAHRVDWRYATAFMPHDAKHKTLVAGGRTVVAQMQRYNFVVACIEATSDRIRHDATWQTIPKVWMNKGRCVDLIAAMMHYHFPYDEDRKVFGSKPVHDWSSHGCSAMELLSRVWKDGVTTVKDMDRAAVRAKFKSLRRKYNVDGDEDPYRMRRK